MEKLKHERLQELLDYNPHSGTFTRKGRSSDKYSGTIAGQLHLDGYIYIRIDGKYYFAHELAWFYAHGYFPENQIKHINRIRDDNRLINLREATRVCNLQNQKIRISNNAGITGVSWHKKIIRMFISALSAIY